MIAILTRVRCYILVILICISLIISWASFPLPVGHLHLLFGKISVQFLYPFCNQVVERYELFLYAGYESLIQHLLFSCSVMSDSLQPHGLQHTRLLCPSPSPGVCSNSCPLIWWFHLTISSSITPFPLALNLSQHQGLFQWVGSSHRVAEVLDLQHQSFQWVFRVDSL